MLYILYISLMIPLNSEDKIHPNTWWQNEQLQVSLQALPNDGRTHFSVQPFPKYPAGQSKNFIFILKLTYWIYSSSTFIWFVEIFRNEITFAIIPIFVLVEQTRIRNQCCLSNEKKKRHEMKTKFMYTSIEIFCLIVLCSKL